MDLARLHASWPELSALLDQALDLSEGERMAWLSTLPAKHSMHRDTLAQLLGPAARIATSGVLEELPRFEGPSREDVDGAIDAIAPGDLVGPYRLIYELGRGGMGTVWLAERADQSPRRRVALKLPHMGWEPNLHVRLARERDILASLEHPHIARLYDAGLDQLGRPYLALEYVAGMPIDRYAETHRLTVRQRLDLLLQVARAVAHAHTRLVVHRDLKPSNILVTASGEIRLLDFGIAKLLQAEGGGDASELTRVGSRRLTPDYASPEQIRGESIGTTSDVYSLGVVAYESLAGKRPYRLKRTTAGERLPETVDIVEVPLASRACADPGRARQLRGDLDAILNKALKQNAAERYPTIDAFAADIERHLRGGPISARPDSAWYRLDRWVRRHKLESAVGAAIVVAVPAGAAAQAAVLAAIGAGATIALWQARLARAQARLAEAERARAEHVKDFALSILLGANTDFGAGAATTAVDVLKAAQERIERELNGQPETSVELMTVVGDGLFGLGRGEDAGEILRKAVNLGRRELGAQHPLTVAASVVYGSVLIGLDRSAEAMPLLRAAIDEAHRQRSSHVLIDALRWMSSAQFDKGDIDDGLASAEAAVAVLADFPSVKKLDATNAWASLANARNVAQREGQADAARRALALGRELYGDRMTGSVLANRLLLAKGLAAENQDRAALDELAAVLVDIETFFGPDHPMLETVANYLGQVRLDCGDAAGAVDAFTIQLAAAGRLVAGSGMRRGLAHSALARALVAARRREEALVHFQTSARLLVTDDGANTLYASRSLSGCAHALARLGRPAEASTAFEALSEVAWPDIDRAQHEGRLSALRTLEGRHDEAVALAREAVKGVVSHPSKIVRAAASAHLGKALLGAGLGDAAITHLLDAARLYREKELFRSADHDEVLADLARAATASV